MNLRTFCPYRVKIRTVKVFRKLAQVKLMTNSDRILRYEAIPMNNVPEDLNRKFIIGIFLSDDTVAVWEVRVAAEFLRSAQALLSCKPNF